VAGSDAVAHEAERGYLVVVVGRGVDDHVGVARLLSRRLKKVEVAHVHVVAMLLLLLLLLLLLGRQRRQGRRGWRILTIVVMVIGRAEG